MEDSSIISNVIIGIISSVLGAIAYAIITDHRQKKIKQKIEELDYEEKFLERISKGNIELLRSSFSLLFFCLGLFGVAGGIILISTAFKFPEFIKYNALVLGATSMFAAGLLSFSHYLSLIKLKNLPKAKSKIDQRRKKLSSKLK